MTCIQFNYTTFIQYYPAFNNATVYPQATLQLYWNEATTYITDQLGAFGFRGAQQVRALNLMTAHLAQLNTLIAAGQGTGVMVGAAYLLLGLPFVELARWAERRLAEGQPNRAL